MKRTLTAIAFAACAGTLPQIALADELLGADLLAEISGKHFDCMQGEIPLEWVISEVASDAKTIAYSATVKGKTVESEYVMTEEGRLQSAYYGKERWVTRNADGSLTMTRVGGKPINCTAR